MAKKDAAAETPKTGTSRQVMYVGPTFIEDGDVFSHGSIFNNGLPAHYSTKVLLEPEFSQLIVPVEKAAKALAELRDGLSFRSQLGRRFLDAGRARAKDKEAVK